MAEIRAVQLGIKEIMMLAGATFFANVIAVFTVVNFQLAPLREAINQNRVAITRLEQAISTHRSEVGHAGMVELMRVNRDTLNSRLDRIEELLSGRP